MTDAVERLRLLHGWLRQLRGLEMELGDCELTEICADASSRRYFRVTNDQGSWIAMDAPPELENCRPFIQVAELLRAAGVNVPRILAQDVTRGFLLLSDLGNCTYLDVLTEDNADALFTDALQALLAWQRASRPGVLAEYDAELLWRELMLFPQWYLEHHLRVVLSVEEQRVLDTVFEQIVQRALAQPKVFVHRDFMPRNLMVTIPNPGVLDFQDAVYGPITYDLASLFKDAFISWPLARMQVWAEHYWHEASRAGLPVAGSLTQFWEELEWMGVQRHLKVLGIFARICYRDGKPHYLGDTPRFVRYVMEVVPRYPRLAPLARIFERHVVSRGLP